MRTDKQIASVSCHICLLCFIFLEVSKHLLRELEQCILRLSSQSSTIGVYSELLGQAKLRPSWNIGTRIYRLIPAFASDIQYEFFGCRWSNQGRPTIFVFNDGKPAVVREIPLHIWVVRPDPKYIQNISKIHDAHVLDCFPKFECVSPTDLLRRTIF